MAIFDPVTKTFHCECGCGTVIPPWNTYASGHYIRTEVTRQLMSEILRGLVHSDEQNQEKSRRQLQMHLDDPTIADRMSEAHTGVLLGDEHCRHISEGMRRAYVEDPTPWIEGGRKRLGMVLDEEACRNMSEGQRRAREEDPTINDRISESLSGMVHSDETRGRMSVGQKKLWAVLSPEDRRKRIQRWCSGQHRRPTKTEELLDEWLQEDFPGEWKYVGDNQVWIEGRNPDFININGRKAVIELFGTYQHELAEVTGGSRSEEGTVGHYKKFGYACLVVWVDTTDDLLYEWITTIKDWVIDLDKMLGLRRIEEGEEK